MSNPASISIGYPHVGGQRRAARTVRAKRTSARVALWNANVCGEFLFLTAWNGTGLAGLVSRLVRRAAAEEDKTLACISAITTWIIPLPNSGPHSRRSWGDRRAPHRTAAPPRSREGDA